MAVKEIKVKYSKFVIIKAISYVMQVTIALLLYVSDLLSEQRWIQMGCSSLLCVMAKGNLFLFAKILHALTTHSTSAEHSALSLI